MVDKASEKDKSDSGGEDEYQSRRSSSTIVSVALKDREVVGGGKKTKGVKGKDKDNKDKDKKDRTEDKADKDKDNKDAFPTWYPYISSYAELKQGMAKSAIL